MKKEKKTTGGILRIAALAAVLIVPLWLTGCGKTVVYEGGDNYPYKIKEKTNGTLVIQLDGSYSPEYEWQYEQPQSVEYTQVDIEGKELDSVVEEAPVELVQKKKEKNGKLKVVVKPRVQTNSYVLNFIRRRTGTQEPTVSFNSAGLSEMVGVDDVTDEFTVSFSVQPNEKGRLLCRVMEIENNEMKGVEYLAEETDYPFYYETQDDLFQVSLPDYDAWEYSLENTSDGTPEEMEAARKAAIAQAQQSMLEDPAWDIDFSQIEDQEYAEELKKAKAEREAYIMDESNWVYDEEADQTEESAGQETGTKEADAAGEEELAWYEKDAYHAAFVHTSVVESTNREELILAGSSVGTTHFTAHRAEDDFTIEFDLKVDIDGNITVEKVTYTGQNQENKTK